MNLRSGQIVAITFADHCEGGQSPIEFTCYGRLISVTPTCLTINGWEYAATDKRRTIDRNTVTWNVVRSAIKSVVQLEAKQ